MGNLFTKNTSKKTTVKNCEVTEQDQAILQLKTQRDKIKQFVKRKEKCMEKERELAKKLIRDGNKERALLLLKKKKYQENVIDQTLKQLDQVEILVCDLEFADIQQRVVDGLKQGNEALKKMNALFDLDEIDKIMEETKEGAEYQEEISNLLSGKLSSDEVDDVERELDELLATEMKQQLPDAVVDELPESEKGKLATEQKEKQKETRERVLLEA